MFKISLFLFILFNSCNSVTINVFVGITGPWRQIELRNNQISASILKRGFISKIHFEEDEEIDEDDQVTTITNMAGLRELEMKSIGQLQIPRFEKLNLIRTIKLSGNQISSVSNESFSKIHPKDIDLSKNQINKIDDGSFGHSLETLILNCNNLNVVSSEWFKDPESLQRLHLTGNKLTTIPDNFKDFIDLSELHLSFNKIVKIADGALAQKQYTYIDVSYNKLTEIKDSSFSSKKVEIMYLNLRANSLNFLSEELMAKLSVTVELTADLNPWLCPCNEKIRGWLPEIVLYNKKNSWLDKQAFDHAHRKDAFCIYDDFGSRDCHYKVDAESTKYYFENIEPFDVEVCQDY